MKQLFSLLAAMLIAVAGFTQSVSGISFHVVDENGAPLVNWPVTVYQGGRVVGTTYTNDDGDALMKPLSPSTYEVRVVLNGMSARKTGIPVGNSDLPAVPVDFRCDAPDAPRPSAGKMMVRVLGADGKPVPPGQLVKVTWKDLNRVNSGRTDSGGVASIPLSPGYYQVSAVIPGDAMYMTPVPEGEPVIRPKEQTASDIRVDSGEVWVSLYVSRPRNWQQEERAGIKAYKKWKKRAARKQRKAERKRRLESGREAR